VVFLIALLLAVRHMSDLFVQVARVLLHHHRIQFTDTDIHVERMHQDGQIRRIRQLLVKLYMQLFVLHMVIIHVMDLSRRFQ